MNKKEKIVICIGLIFIPIFLLLGIYGNYQRQNYGICQGTILELKQGIDYPDYTLCYNYEVNGVKYTACDFVYNSNLQRIIDGKGQFPKKVWIKYAVKHPSFLTNIIFDSIPR